MQEKLDHTESSQQNAFDSEGVNRVDDKTDRYPAKYFHQRDNNDKMRMLHDAAQLAEDINIERPSFDNDLKRIIVDRQREAELFNFDKWIQASFDTSNPVTLRLLNELHPGFMDIRRQEIERQYELAKKIELLNLTGPQSQDDLILLFQLNAGQITAPDLQIKTGKEGTDVSRGYFNFRKWVTGSDSIRHKKSEGLGTDAFLGTKFDSNNVPLFRIDPAKPSNSQMEWNKTFQKPKAPGGTANPK